jgi:uncharacterized protein YndB with AHSA1/START domain
MNHSNTGETISEEIKIKAPADQIFAALTSPEERVRWWGSEGRFKTTHMESDLRPGGRWLMRGNVPSTEAGRVFWNGFEHISNGATEAGGVALLHAERSGAARDTSALVSRS